MKTTMMTFALALASLPLTFAQTPASTPAPAAPVANKPAATTTTNTTKKHHKKAAKKSVKTPAASTAPAPVKQ